MGGVLCHRFTVSVRDLVLTTPQPHPPTISLPSSPHTRRHARLFSLPFFLLLSCVSVGLCLRHCAMCTCKRPRSSEWVERAATPSAVRYLLLALAVYTTPELVVACILPEPTVHAVPALVKSASLQKQQQCAQHVRQWSSTLQLRLDQRSQCFQQLRHGCVRDSRVGRKRSASPSGGLHLTRQPPPHRQW